MLFYESIILFRACMFCLASMLTLGVQYKSLEVLK